MSDKKDEENPPQTEPISAETEPSAAESQDLSLPESGTESVQESPDSSIEGSVEPVQEPPPLFPTIERDKEERGEQDEAESGKVDYDVEAAEGGSQETYTVDDAVNLAGYGKFQKVLTFLAGLGWFADAFEVIILSLIGDMLACEWKMQRWQNALMTSLVFCGMMFGAPIFGIFADKYGRRTALAISMLLIFVFGAASAFSPSYAWMVVLRALMGFALGGIAQGVTLCCEYYPAKLRGRAGFYLSYYWALGTICLVGSAWIVMQHFYNWRAFVFVAAVPALIVFLCMKWYPESARYYIVSKQTEKAVKTLQKLAKMNKSEMPKGRLVEMEASEERGRIPDLLKPNMRRTTLLFWYIWLAVACAYYGIALVTPYIVTNKSLIDAARAHVNASIAEEFTAQMPCVNFSHENFADLMWTSAAEFPGLLIFTFTIEQCPRTVYLGTSLLLLSLLILPLMLKIEPEIVMLIILFVGRGLVAAIFQLLFIMTTEAFPTTLRASAMGTGSGCARLGGLIIPYLAQVGMISNPTPSIFILAGSTALAGIAALLLPVETRGLHMTDSLLDTRHG